VLEANERSLTERATALKMLSGAKSSTPTNLALIVMGINARNYLPGDYVQFLRIDGDDLSEPIIDAAQIDGRIDEIIRRTEDKFVAHNRVKVDIVSSEREIRTYQYPLGALQQVLRNAVMHRTYEASNAPIRVTWFNERIEMQSPGGPFGAVSVDNFGQPGVTDYRNPSLSESLRVLGFVQRFGVGIATARNLLEKNGNSALEFRVDGSFVTAIIPARC
jgi:ATP-dependent DNA helicase RecG